MDYLYWTHKAIVCIQQKVHLEQKFVVKDLFQGAEWETLSNGEKRSYGRYFKNEVKEGRIPNVVFIQRKNNNHSEYKKVKGE